MRYELWRRVDVGGAFNWMVYDTNLSPTNGAATWFETREEAEEMIANRDAMDKRPDPGAEHPA